MNSAIGARAYIHYLRISTGLCSFPTDPEGLLWRYACHFLDPSTRIFAQNLIAAPGYDATAYMNTFSVLEKEQTIGKVVLLAASDNGEREAPLHPLPQFKLDAVFTSDKLPRVTRKLAPLTVGTSNNLTSNGGLVSPQSPPRAVGRLIDPCLVCFFLLLHNIRN